MKASESVTRTTAVRALLSYARRAFAYAQDTFATCLLLGFVAAAMWWPRISGPIDLRWDGGSYYILGTSMAEARGYRLLSEPGEIRPTHYPPFLPAFVALYQLAMNTSDTAIIGRALRLSMALFGIAYTIAIYLFLRAYIPWICAVAATLMSVIQPQLVYFSDSLYAETFFSLFTVLFFICQRHSRRAMYFVLSGVLAVLAYETRTAGIILLATWVGNNLLHRDIGRTALALGISLVAVLSWTSWIAAVESSPDYLHPAYAYQRAPYVYFNVSYQDNIFKVVDPAAPEYGSLTPRAFIHRVYGNIRRLPSAIGEAVSVWDAPRYISLPLGCLVFMGLLLQAARRQYVLLLYVVLSLAVLCITPFPKQFVRYLLPLCSFFVLALFQFLVVLVRGLRFRMPVLPVYAGAAVVTFVVCMIIIYQARSVRDLYRFHHDVAYEDGGQLLHYRLFFYAPFGKAFDEALDWLQRRLKGTDVIAGSDPQWVYLRTGTKAVLPPFELDGKKAQQLVDSVPVKYLITETAPQPLGLGMYYRYTSALVRDNPDNWRRIWRSSNGSMEVYERSVDGRTTAAPN